MSGFRPAADLTAGTRLRIYAELVIEGPSAVVDADDVRRVVGAYADPVHDAVLRAGCPGSEASEVLEDAVRQLLDALIRSPAGVRDLLGCWLREAERLAGQRSSAVHIRRDDAEALRVRGVLDALDAADRRALMFRDAYDLPPASAAVALDTDVVALRERLAGARLDFLRRYDAASRPAVPAACGTHPSELAALSDRTLPPMRASTLRRHTYGCPGCEEVADAQERARRIIGGLPVLGLDPAIRAGVLARTGAIAERRLSILDAMLAPAEVSSQDRSATEQAPIVSPVLVAVAIAAALLAGVGIGLSNVSMPQLHRDRTATSQPAPARPSAVLRPSPAVPSPGGVRQPGSVTRVSG